VTLVDTGPLVALFDPKDAHHARCRDALRGRRDSLTTTVPVLTEAFHLLSPASRGSQALRGFVLNGGLSVWYLDSGALARAFELMERYADQRMDLADASLVVAAERLRTRDVMTIDRKDFVAYRIQHGHRRVAFRVTRCE
jgi:predicted nucleic acid-binding protein